MTDTLEPAALAAERKALLRRRRNNLLLVLPLLLFITFSFVAPISSMLHRSAYNPTLVELIPRTISALADWRGDTTPPTHTLNAFSVELQQLAQTRQSGRLAAAINRAQPGASSLVNATARQLRNVDANTLANDGARYLIQADPRWGDLGLWHAINQLGAPYHVDNFLTALDLERMADGAIQARIYLTLYAKTLGMALVITLLCAALGYPLAYYLAHAPRRQAGMLLVLVLLPFWTSLLVRTTAWIALLQTNGVVNTLLQSLGLIDQPLEMLYTRFATIIAMTHILLPFMVLPLYSVMRGINPSYVRAALSLGSSPWSAFWRVYWPQSLPGLTAGVLLVFIISVGYYITPALVGGTDGQMISNLIAFHMQQSNNWGLAAALGALLLALITVLYWLYDRLAGHRNMTLG